MGRATTEKSDQIQYLKNRVKLLSYVIGALNADMADAEDLGNVLRMVDDLKVKIKRFQDDWKTKQNG
ncbi:SE1561 family protein [Terrilactibacillus sp. S3-3]|nr:SE1561 family protein [Terrilactibacillus sp. S3-3]